MAKNIDFKAICDAENALREYLEANPHMQDFQNRYTEYMKKAGPNPENRLIYFKQFLRDVMAEHHATMTDARDKLLKFAENMRALATDDKKPN